MTQATNNAAKTIETTITTAKWEKAWDRYVRALAEGDAFEHAVRNRLPLRKFNGYQSRIAQARRAIDKIDNEFMNRITTAAKAA